MRLRCPLVQSARDSALQLVRGRPSSRAIDDYIEQMEARRVRQRLSEDAAASQNSPAHPTTPPSDDGNRITLNITSQLTAQFDNPTLSDVTLVCGTTDRRTFRCHKVVLASMSTYFNALFTAGMQESSQSEVVLQDVDPDLCERVLRLLYGQPQELTPENVLTFVHLGDFYGISQLQKHTESLLETFVTVDASNCCAKLAEAAALRCTQAQLHCRRILLSDFAAALKQPAFPSLELPVLAEVLEPDELLCEKVRTSARVMSSSTHARSRCAAARHACTLSPLTTRHAPL